MKTCKDCGECKPIDTFYRRQGECKECSKKRVRANRIAKIGYYRRYDKDRQIYDPIRVFSHRYSQMRLRVLGKATRPYKVEGRPICTQKEFLEWCEMHKTEYDDLFKIWAANSFDRRNTPSRPYRQQQRLHAR